jgi:hypothetical protein
MDSIEFSFPGMSSAAASRAAQSLRAKLIAEGVAPSRLHVKRDDPSAMDTGGNLWLDILHWGALTVEIVSIANTVYDLCRREKGGFSFRIGDKRIEVSPGEIDVEKLMAAMMKAINDGKPS